MTKNIFLLCVLSLVGCGGGGGGGSSSSGASGGTTPFKQWSQVTPKSTVQATGGFTYVSGYSSYQSPGGALVTATLDSNRYISILTLQTPLSSASFNTAAGDTISSSVYSTAFVAYNKAQTAAAIFANPYAAGWEYQTFGVWGIPSGPYVVLPFFGPSNVRDTFGAVADLESDYLFRLLPDVALRNSLTGLRVVNTRNTYYEAGDLLDGAALDKYSFVRDAYIQRRAYQINEGRDDEEPLMPVYENPYQ